MSTFFKDGNQNSNWNYFILMKTYTKMQHLIDYTNLYVDIWKFQIHYERVVFSGIIREKMTCYRKSCLEEKHGQSDRPRSHATLMAEDQIRCRWNLGVRAKRLFNKNVRLKYSFLYYVTILVWVWLFQFNVWISSSIYFAPSIYLSRQQQYFLLTWQTIPMTFLR